jgi:aminoglycoside/choline kinase family phosphotransferase
MDAPPDKENIGPWLDIGARLRAAGLHAPEVFAVDRAAGFVLMEDLGARLYLPELNDKSVDALYADALDALLRMQTHVDPGGLPVFDEAFVTMELELMPEWFLRRHLGHAIECDEWDVIELAFRVLINEVRAQPQAFMHRDYHSRNLLVMPRTGDAMFESPGIIDFQGAMNGPIAYDLASLLRDCYIAWDAERVDGWLDAYGQRLRHAHLIDTHVDGARLRRWFDLAGLQRHIKVLGIFCRLWYRDGKRHYLADLPLTWRYVITVARRYPETAALADLLERALGDRDITSPRDEATAA